MSQGTSVTSRLCALLLCLSLLPSVVSCSNRRELPAGPAREALAAPASAERRVLGALCDTEEVSCHEGAGQGIVIEYVLTSTAAMRSDSAAVLVDPGGPGVYPMQPDLLREKLPKSLLDFKILMLVEPWVARNEADACADALIRNTGPNLEPCVDGLQFSPQSYRSLAVFADTDVAPIVGIYALSHGAVRASWVWGELSPKWVAIDSPAPMSQSVSREAMLHLRATNLAQLLKENGVSCGHKCPWGMSTASEERQNNAAYALLAMSYDLNDNLSVIKQWAISGDLPGYVGTQDEIAFQFTGLDVGGQISREVVGHLAGECQTRLEGDWNPESDLEARSLYSALHDFYAYCQHFPRPTTPSFKPFDGPVYLSVNSLDPVIPLAHQLQWARQVPSTKLTLVRRSVLAHGAEGSDRGGAAKFEEFLSANG